METRDTAGTGTEKLPAGAAVGAATAVGEAAAAAAVATPVDAAEGDAEGTGTLRYAIGIGTEGVRVTALAACVPPRGCPGGIIAVGSSGPAVDRFKAGAYTHPLFGSIQAL
jgi:hypothetical protein